MLFKQWCIPLEANSAAMYYLPIAFYCILITCTDPFNKSLVHLRFGGCGHCLQEPECCQKFLKKY